MNSVNRLVLIGRAGIDAELRYAPSGVAQANFKLATSDFRTGPAGRKEVTEWHEVRVEGALGYDANDPAKRASLIVRKGSQIYVEGRLSYRRAYDHSEAPLKAVVVAQRVEVLASPAAAPEAPSKP